MAVKIILVDDHPLFLKGLRAILDTEEVEILAEANDGFEAIEMVKKYNPEVVVMDINMPNFSGIDATKQILAENPEIKVLALSMHSGKQYVKSMLDAGAVGYLLKDSGPDEFLTAIKKVIKGDMYLSSAITSIALGRDESQIKPPPLSLREIEILEYVAEGLRNKEIATKTFVSSETVKKHLYNISKKLDVSNRINLVAKAKELGVIDG